MDRDDREALDGCARGDLASLERLYRAHGDRIYSIARRLLGSAADAEDVTQEVFLTVLRKAHTFNASSTVATWLYRVTVNTSSNWRREGRRRTKREERWSEAERLSNPGPSGPEDRAVCCEETRRLRAAMERLPERYRVALVLHDIEGLSYDDVAGALGVRPGTVASRLSRARARLLALLEEAS